MVTPLAIVEVLIGISPHGLGCAVTALSTRDDARRDGLCDTKEEKNLAFGAVSYNQLCPYSTVRRPPAAVSRLINVERDGLAR
jgi:hypothetical protein